MPDKYLFPSPQSWEPNKILFSCLKILEAKSRSRFGSSKLWKRNQELVFILQNYGSRNKILLRSVKTVEVETRSLFGISKLWKLKQDPVLVPKKFYTPKQVLVAVSKNGDEGKAFLCGGQNLKEKEIASFFLFS
jgi:hypothetical protein